MYLVRDGTHTCQNQPMSFWSAMCKMPPTPLRSHVDGCGGPVQNTCVLWTCTWFFWGRSSKGKAPFTVRQRSHQLFPLILVITPVVCHTQAPRLRSAYCSAFLVFMQLSGVDLLNFRNRFNTCKISCLQHLRFQQGPPANYQNNRVSDFQAVPNKFLDIPWAKLFFSQG